MPAEAAAAAVAFVGMFTMWVVVPSVLKRRHDQTEDVQTIEER